MDSRLHCQNDDLSTDLDGIKIEDLNLGCEFFKEFLNPATNFQPASECQEIMNPNFQGTNITVSQQVLEYLGLRKL